MPSKVPAMLYIKGYTRYRKNTRYRCNRTRTVYAGCVLIGRRISSHKRLFMRWRTEEAVIINDVVGATLPVSTLILLSNSGGSVVK